MKVVFIILSIAMMSQVCLAGVLGRFRRDAIAEGFDSALDLIKYLAQVSGPLVTAVLKKIPNTEAYAIYRNDLEEYLKSYNEYKTKEGICFLKSLELSEKLIQIIENYGRENAPAEAKKISELFNSFESEDFEKEIVEFVKKAEAIESIDLDEIVKENEIFKIQMKILEKCD